MHATRQQTAVAAAATVVVEESHGGAETEPGPPTQAEFDGAFTRLLERAGGLRWRYLTQEQMDALSLLAEDNAALLRHDQEVLRDWAASKGIDMSRDYNKPNAAVLYMAALLHKQGYTRVDDALQDVKKYDESARRRRLDAAHCWHDEQTAGPPEGERK